MLLKARLFRRVLTALSRGVVEVANFHKHQKQPTCIRFTYIHILMYSQNSRYLLFYRCLYVFLFVFSSSSNSETRDFELEIFFRNCTNLIQNSKTHSKFKQNKEINV